MPRYTIIKRKALNSLPEVLEKLNLKNPLVVSGRNTKKYNKFDYDLVLYDEEIEVKGYDCIIGLGGGKAIDVAKYIAYKNKLPVISVPTTASNDGISSPVVALKKPSFLATAPIAVIADIDIIEKSPKRLLRAGLGDIVSNITAVLDWKLAKEEVNEKFSEGSAIFSMTIAKELINYILNSNLEEYVSKLTKALIGSGICIAMANTTRPASGGEHLFSHALDLLKEKYNFNSLHGEQCGVGTLIISYLHKKEGRENYLEEILESLKKVKAPITFEDLGIDREIAREALTLAPKIRKRWTILRNGLREEEIEDVFNFIESL
ncbi:3-dehydroquinate synthase [Methanocaldococcus infernus ME]|uniref:3-dehydroquinate synthase n=1 Tax=Methanocaldococcus infernus (strain DSM 11812 / JCM 15783 / ME) TaxID=573063 RepID=D5VRH4_METIM|nr:sn-glycerol-1-phosphate dehydrogenase [Methanocaldococcus infernus]ADG13177.1 3-dehydroquinate synthase [Methanocaldococcus infernus ME]